MSPDEPTDEDKLEQLPDDGKTPFSLPAPPRDPAVPPDDSRQTDAALDDTHPSTDTDIQQEEVYEEGKAAAAEASEPNAGNSVINYQKDEEKDNEQEKAA